MVKLQHSKIVTAIALASVIGMGGSPAMSDDAAAIGEGLAKNKCAFCHAIGVEGARKVVKATAFRDFAAATATEKLTEALNTKLARGHAGLPALDPEGMKSLAAYLERLKSGGASQSDANTK